MFRHNLPFKKISLLAATCGGLLVSLATLSQAGGPRPNKENPFPNLQLLPQQLKNPSANRLRLRVPAPAGCPQQPQTHLPASQCPVRELRLAKAW